MCEIVSRLTSGVVVAMVRCRLVVPLALAAWALPAMAADAPAVGSSLTEHDDPEAMRLRLTRRVDVRRPANPRSFHLLGRPLTLSGEYEMELDFARQLEFDEEAGDDNWVRLEQDLQVELFYSPGPKRAVYMEGELEWEQDLHHSRNSTESDVVFERGESWLYAEDLRGSDIDLEVGRLNFEDERRSWWDEELDGVRLSRATETFALSVAVAQEVLPIRSDQSFVDPEQEDVLRLIAESSWNYTSDHRLGLFLLHQMDGSPTQRAGETVDDDREDESDATLTWFGVRMMGAWPLQAAGLLTYWMDGAYVRGREQLSEYEDFSGGKSIVEETSRRDVSGWAFDGGLTWIVPTPMEPRFTLGYAIGSGDRDPEEGADRAYRQTGIHDNEAGFGGVRRFSHYGLLLEPELSNLHVATAGFGLSLFASSSLDLVYHHYSQVQAAPFLRDGRIEVELDGDSRDVGHEVDLVLAVEEWERLELQLLGSVFRSGSAFGDQSGELTYLAGAAVRISF